MDLVAEGDDTALIQASGEGHFAIVKLLVSKGADVNLGVEVRESDWFWRVSRGDRNGAVNLRTEFRFRTPLSEARGEGDLAIVTFLISAGARD